MRNMRPLSEIADGAEPEKFNRVFVMLTAGKHLVSKLIRTVTDAPYSHVSVGIDPLMREFYGYNISLFAGRNMGGFTVERLEDYARDATFSLYSAPITEEQAGKFSETISEFKANPAKIGYNMRGLAGYALFGSDVRPADNALYCSQFVREVLISAGMGNVIGDKFQPGKAMIPYDFSRAPGLKFEKRGKIGGLITMRDAGIRIFQAKKGEYDAR
jgi:hypothetical protein